MLCGVTFILDSKLKVQVKKAEAVPNAPYCLAIKILNTHLY